MAFKMKGFSGFKKTSGTKMEIRKTKDSASDLVMPSAMKRHVPSHMSDATAGNKRKHQAAKDKMRNVESRRGSRGKAGSGPKIKSIMGKSTEGTREGGEYKMGIADMRLFGGVGKKALRNSGLALEGDHAKHVKKNRRKRDKLKKQGKLDSHGSRI